MRYNIVLAGVGGQGILSIARIISQAALNQGLHVKQAEVHGMSQRGGAVYSHVRLSSEEIFSDLVPAGQADMILSLEPLEALRYASMLQPEGAVVTGSGAVANVPAYPSVEDVLDHVSAFRHHIAVDLDRLGRAAGSTLAANIVALGAASCYLQFSTRELEDAIAQVFERKGERVVEVNLRAFRFGRNAGLAYLAALQRGLKPSEVRSWIEAVPPEELASEEFPEAPVEAQDAVRLTSSEASAFESVLMEAYDEGRSQLYEHEVYSLLELIGAINAPVHRFIPKGSTIDEAALQTFPGERVVLKLVSQDVVHKSDVGAVRFVPKELGAVRKEIDALITRHSPAARVAGTLLVEYVEHRAGGLGSELFVGIRSTREFGPVIAAGLGGLDTEYMASRLKPGKAVAKALALECDAEGLLELFKETVAYEILSGAVRGHERVVADAELLRCFRAFLGIARRFCIDRGEEGPDVGELEVNPFAFKDQRLLPLDGRGCLRSAAKPGPVRDLDSVRALLEPRRIAMVGVSEKPGGLGRVILAKVLGSGFDPGSMSIVKEGGGSIEGVVCVSSVDALPDTDLVVVATPAAAAPGLVKELAESGRIRAGIVISGGAGETEQSSDLGAELREAMTGSRPDGKGPVFVGPNCMGLRSLPGRFDTLFVPDDKLTPCPDRPADPVAILSQSGAFAVSRLSKLGSLNPQFVVSFGNQYDVTLSDLLRVLGERDDVRVAAVYMEGFADMDGLASVRAVREWTEAGKTVVLYKAGRSAAGRSAAAGHTAAVAGDYDICLTAFEGAGAVLAHSLDEFNALVELSSFMANVTPEGDRIFAVTNAGMEAVAMADTLGELDHSGWLAGLGDDLAGQLATLLAECRLDAIASVRNPLDLTPMADERVYDRVVREALASSQVDAVVVSCVPLAPGLKTLINDLDHPEAFPQLARGWLNPRKPVVLVLDGGALYDPLAERLRSVGLPVFRSADVAVRALAAWLRSCAGKLQRVEAAV